MERPSRREFLESVSLLAVSGLGAALISPRAGIIRPRQQTPQIDPDFEPGYLELHRSGELQRRGQVLWSAMEQCNLCPRQCGANRLDGEKGFCEANSQLMTASFHPHFGEERPLVGRGGSGAVFFSNCNLRCVFCINWQISQGGLGRRESLESLAQMMLSLQRTGCHNINIVTPTHYSAHVVMALDIAAENGLKLPLVYNTCGWERLEILEQLDGVVDIYLPDFKYADGVAAARFSSGADTYSEITKAGLLEMHRQVGVAKPAPDGLMYRGLMVRHLIMPNNVGGSKDVIAWVAEHLPADTYLNLMSQYRPMFRASEYPEISRPINRDEYDEVVEHARAAGLTNLDIQPFRSS